MRSRGKESTVPKYGSHKKQEKKEKTHQNMKRSTDESHTQTFENLNDIFCRSQMPFSIRREQ